MTARHVINRGLAATTAALLATQWYGSAAKGQGSDLPDGSVIIDALPFSETGTTIGFADDRNVEQAFDCPYAGGMAPDVFYAITPVTDTYVNISLCDSLYDTKLYVLVEGDEAIACNDDECVNELGDPTLRSSLECVFLEAGRRYDIGIDGFGDFAGTYVLVVTECEPPPPFECPAESIPEGEPCVDGAPDTFNAGCNANPPVFSPVACDDTICGETWETNSGARDTNWYEIVTTGESTRFVLEGQFNFDEGIIGLVDMRPGSEGSGNCDHAQGITPFGRGGPGEPIRVTTDFLPAGRHWFFVSTATNDVIECAADNDYWLRVTCQEELTCNPLCPSDINVDGVVDFGDILQILVDWGPCPE